MLTTRIVLLFLFLISGATGLVYELVWTRELIFVFGGTTYAITTVLAAFMGGLGLGSYIAGRLTPFVRRPGLVYGVLEILIGLYALAVPSLLGMAEPMYRGLYNATADFPGVLVVARFFVGAMVMLLPACLMGATLPLLVRFITLRGAGVGESVSLLYGVNALGAVVGVLLTGFVLIPYFGLSTSTHIAAGLNISVGVVALLFLWGGVTTVTESQPNESPSLIEPSREPDATATLIARDEPLSEPVRKAVLLAFAASGFAAMVYQIMWTRTLAMLFGSSTYCFTCVLAAFILGLSVGSLTVGRWVDRWRKPVLVMAATQLLIGLTATLVQPLYGLAPEMAFELVESHQENYSGLLFMQFLIIFAITCLPTFLMGAQFPLATRVLSRGVEDAGLATGRAYAVNTIGTILGSLLGGFLLLRMLGAQSSIVVAATINAAAGVWLIWVTHTESTSRAARVKLVALLATAAIPLTAVLADTWNPLEIASGPFMGRGERPSSTAKKFELLYLGEGVDTTVVVSRSIENQMALSLSVNGKPDASTLMGDLSTQILVGHLPILVAPERKLDVCVIGLGSGMTLGAVTRYRDVKSIDCAEISEEVITGANFFNEFTYYAMKDPRVSMRRADGRNHLFLSDKVYDVIISEPSNPWIVGVASLFTQEFFQIAKSRLAPDGVVAIWMQGYSTSAQDFRMVLRTISTVFDFVTVWEMGRNDYAVIAGNAPFHRPLDVVRTRFESPPVRADLCRIAMGRLERLLANYFTSSEELAEWIGPGELHVDDRTQLEFSAPRNLYVSKTSEILERLTRAATPPFDDVVALPDNPEIAQWFRERVHRTVLARASRVTAESEVVRASDPLAIGRELVNGYRLDPGNLDLFERMVDFARGLNERRPDLAETPSGSALLLEIAQARAPILIPPWGGPLYDHIRRLISFARGAGEDGHWRTAYDYLDEALDIDPRNADAVLATAWVLSNSDAPEEAIRGLEEAVAHAVVTREQIAATEELALLRNHPRFTALIAGASATQPNADEPQETTDSTGPASQETMDSSRPASQETTDSSEPASPDTKDSSEAQTPPEDVPAAAPSEYP